MDNFFKVLETLLTKLKGIDFALLGTFNLFIQGIKIKPQDLDLITGDNGIKKIAAIFNSKITRNDLYLETEFVVNEIEVHVVSDKNNLLRGPFKESVVWVKIGDLRAPCLSLESERSFYQRAGREKDCGKIELILQKLSEKK